MNAAATSNASNIENSRLILPLHFLSVVLGNYIFAQPGFYAMPGLRFLLTIFYFSE
jgi:hypothetical protein